MEYEITELDHEKAKLGDYSDVHFDMRNGMSSPYKVFPIYSAMLGKSFYQFQIYDSKAQTSEFTEWFPTYPKL